MSLTSYWMRRASTARCDNAAMEHWLVTSWFDGGQVHTLPAGILGVAACLFYNNEEPRDWVKRDVTRDGDFTCPACWRLLCAYVNPSVVTRL